jgi:hypothetical protein
MTNGDAHDTSRVVEAPFSGGRLCVTCLKRRSSLRNYCRRKRLRYDRFGSNSTVDCRPWVPRAGACPPYRGRTRNRAYSPIWSVRHTFSNVRYLRGGDVSNRRTPDIRTEPPIGSLGRPLRVCPRRCGALRVECRRNGRPSASREANSLRYVRRRLLHTPLGGPPDFQPAVSLAFLAEFHFHERGRSRSASAVGGNDRTAQLMPFTIELTM